MTLVKLIKNSVGGGVALISLGAGQLYFASSASAITLVSNGVYEAHIQSSLSGDGSQFGSWNAVTGPTHTVGAGKDLLYNQTATTTNFSSLRIFGTTNTTYTFGGAGGGLNLDLYLASETVLTEYGSPAFRTVWDLTPESLGITQDVIVYNSASTNESNSAIYHTVEITNNGNETKSIGWRNLYDWAVNDPGFDDGPSNSIETPPTTVVIGTTTNEFTYKPTSNEYVRVTADPPPLGGATYQPLLGIGFDPGFIASLPVTRPTQYSYASWPGSFGTAFDYTTTGANVTSDSAGLTWFGLDPASAISLAPGKSVRLNQVIFASVPDAPPPCDPATGNCNKVPEPTSTLGILALGVLGVGSRFKHKLAQAKKSNKAEG
jgi:hypothetical protein